MNRHISDAGTANQLKTALQPSDTGCCPDNTSRFSLYKEMRQVVCNVVAEHL